MFLVGLLYLSRFNHPSADDFCYATTAMQRGFGNFQEHLYLTWSGRYVATLLIGSQPFLADLFGLSFFTFYRLLTGLHFLLFIIAVYVTLQTIDKFLKLPYNPFWLTMVFMTTFLASITSLPEAIYWAPGFFSYSLGLIFFLFLFCAICTLQFHEARNHFERSIYLLTFFLLALWIGGTSEVSIFVSLTLATMALLLCLRIGSRTALAWMIVLVGLLIAGAIVTLSPGTLERHAEAGPSPGLAELGKIMVLSAYTFANNVTQWWVEPLVLGSSVLLLFARIEQQPKQIEFSVGVFLLGLTAWVCLVYGCMLLNFLGSASVVGRVLNIAQFIFVFGWFMLVLYARNIWHGYLREWSHASRTYIAIAAQCVWVIAMTHHFTVLVRELTLVAPGYHIELIERYAQIAEALNKNEQVLEVAELQAKPSLLFWRDITESQSHWRNECYANFFGLEAISIRPE